MKIERLLKIIIYLLNNNRVTGMELSSRFEVSLRTIQRDIDTLTLAGIPIIAYGGVEGGYEIDSNYKTHIQLSNDSEYAFIMTSLEALYSVVGYKEIEDTYEKISSLKKSNELGHISLDFGIANDIDYVNQLISKLDQAIKENNIILFSYVNVKDEKSSKRVKPLALNYKWYAWYLIAYDLDKKEQRTYKLVRMESVEVTQDKAPDYEIDQNLVFEYNSGEFITVRVLCKKQVKMKVIEYLQGVVESTDEDGNYIMRIYVPRYEFAWKGTLISLGSNVKILEPESLKVDLKEIIDEFSKVNFDE